MKTTVHQCLESMMFDWLMDVMQAIEVYKSAQIDFFKNRNDTADIALWQAKDNLYAALTRMSDLETAKRIIDEMEIKSARKYISNKVLLIFALMIVTGLVAILSMVAIILLLMLGRWIEIDMDIFLYFTAFCIFWKAWDVLNWVIGKIADRIERKKVREYFERLNKKR